MAKLLIPTDTSQAALGYLLADGTIVGSTSQAQDFGSNGIKADVIAESTGAAGVTIDGFKIKDGALFGGVSSSTAILEDDGVRTFIGGGIGGSVEIYDTNAAGTRVAQFNPSLITIDQDTKFAAAAGIGLMGATPSSVTVFNVGASTTAYTALFGGLYEYNGTSGAMLGFNVTAKYSATGAGGGNFFGFSIIAQANTVKNLTVFTGARYILQSLPGQSGTIATMTGLDFVWTLIGSKPTTSRGINIPNIGHADITTIEAIKIAALTAGTNTYQIREFGTTGFNVLAGDTGIGATSDPTEALDVTGNLLASGNAAFAGAAIEASTVLKLSPVVSSTITRVIDANLTYTGSAGISIKPLSLTLTHQGTSAGGATGVAMSLTVTADRTVGTTVIRGFDLTMQSAATQSATLSSATALSILTPSWGGSKPSAAVGISIGNIGHADITTVIALTIAAQTAGSGVTTNINQEGTVGINILAAQTMIGANNIPVATLDVDGGIALATVAKTGDYTATSSDHGIFCDASGGAFTITLPAASSVPGIQYHIKKIDSSGNAVTVDANGSETIDDALTQVINVQYDSMMISCDGSNWHII